MIEGMDILKSEIMTYSKLKKKGKKYLMAEKEDALAAFNRLANSLESGRIRTAEPTEDGWKVNEWVKEGILLGFALGKSTTYNKDSDISYIDKDTFPVRNIPDYLGVRVVPPAAGVRRGAYVAEGCVLMPPAYVNTGTYVDEGTMIEGLVGSCAQVGKDCHLSAGSVLGGVLDPVGAIPVIIGDDVLLGENSGVTEGSRLGNLCALAPGVHITKATPVLDPINGVAYTSQGTAKLRELGTGAHIPLRRIGKLVDKKDSGFGPVVPDGALVVPGIYLSNRGELAVTPIIAKYIEKVEDRSFELEEDLR